MPTPKSTEALIYRTIKACQLAGMTIARVEVSPDGTVKAFDVDAPHAIPAPKSSQAEQTCDHLFGLTRPS